MDRVRLLPIQLPSASNINNTYRNPKEKISFMKRLLFGLIILAGLGLLYVPAYHSVQGQIPSVGVTSSSVKSMRGIHSIAFKAQLYGWDYNKTRNICTYIQPNNVTIIINPKNMCNHAPYLLIVICSAVENVEARLAIRNTWGNKTYLDYIYNNTVKLAFLLGHSNNNTFNEYVIDESNLYNDVIQENFHDTYNNLTLKSVMLLKWVTRSCNKLTYLMKTDDDMFVNIPTLIMALKKRLQTTRTLIGSLICNAKPIADPKNKWYTPEYMYSETTFPNYLSGTGYVMSLDVVFLIYRAALSTPLLHLEDVYITGVCAKRASLKPLNHYGFSYVPRKLEGCTLREIITAHKITASNMYHTWDKVKKLLTDTNYCTNHSIINKKTTSSNKIGRHIGYFLLKNRILSNKCI